MSIFGRKPRDPAVESPSEYFARGLPRGPLVRQLQFLHEIFMLSDLATDPNENFRLVFEDGLKKIAVFTQAQEAWRYDPDRPPPTISSRPPNRDEGTSHD